MNNDKKLFLCFGLGLFIAMALFGAVYFSLLPTVNGSGELSSNAYIGSNESTPSTAYISHDRLFWLSQGLTIQEPPDDLLGFDLTNPYALISYIWKACDNSDSYKLVDVDAHLFKNETHVIFSFKDVKIIKETATWTEQVEVGWVYAVFKKETNYSLAIFLDNYEMGYGNLNATYVINIEPLGGSVESIIVDEMWVSHDRTPRQEEP